MSQYILDPFPSLIASLGSFGQKWKKKKKREEEDKWKRELGGGGAVEEEGEEKEKKKKTNNSIVHVECSHSETILTENAD